MALASIIMTHVTSEFIVVCAVAVIVVVDIFNVALHMGMVPPPWW